MRQPAIGIDIGGTFIKAGIITATGEILKKVSAPTGSAEGPNGVVGSITTLIHNLLDEQIVPRQELEGIGVGCPGPLSQADGVIYETANMPGWDHFPLRQRLHESLGFDVTLENDGNAAAWGEFVLGAGRGAASMALLTLGTGVGGGIIIDGRVLHGGWFNAGEIGHMIVEPSGPQCSCGQRGCLERFSSAKAILERYLEGIQANGKASGDLAERVRQGAVLDARDVVAALDHDPIARHVWDDACRYLAIACVNLQHLLNPQRIIFGGGVSAAGDVLLGPVRQHFENLTWHFKGDRPTLERATLGNDAGLIGAASLCYAHSAA